MLPQKILKIYKEQHNFDCWWAQNDNKVQARYIININVFVSLMWSHKIYILFQYLLQGSSVLFRFIIYVHKKNPSWIHIQHVLQVSKKEQNIHQPNTTQHNTPNSAFNFPRNITRSIKENIYEIHLCRNSELTENKKTEIRWDLG